MKKIKRFRTKLGFLQDTINYYWGDENRYNVRMLNGMKHTCCYAPASDKSDGCAIGRMLPIELCKELDQRFNGGTVTSIFDDLPNWMKKLEQGFLRQLQILHDKEYFVKKDEAIVKAVMGNYVDANKIKFPK